MKKLFFAVIAIFFAINANAQFGIIAGVTSTQTDYKTAWAKANEINQFHVGATVKIPLPLGFAVQPAIIYNMKGSSVESAVAGETFTVDSKTGFIEVPVQAQWGISFAGVVRPYAFVEPFVGYAITNEETSSLKLSSFTGENSKENWDNVKNRLEYGFGLGVGVELIKHLQVSVRYFWNMGELYDESGSAAWDKINETIDASAKTAEEQKCAGVMASVAILF